MFVIINVELNSGKHVSNTQDHLQALVDTLLILKQSYMRLDIVQNKKCIYQGLKMVLSDRNMLPRV
jgi:hypothetical protein